MYKLVLNLLSWREESNGIFFTGVGHDVDPYRYAVSCFKQFAKDHLLRCVFLAYLKSA